MSAPDSDRLESWKEIAAYLGRTEKTARRWEQSEGLPVHRLVHQERGSVYAFRSELDLWRSERTAKAPIPPEVEAPSRVRPATVGVIAAALACAVALYATIRSSDGVATAPPVFAVLPFQVDSTETTDAYLATSLPAALTDQLSRARDLRVRPFESALHASRDAEDPAAAGRRLRADLVATGRVRVHGDFELSISLVSVASDAQIWAETYPTSPAALGATLGRISQSLREEALRATHGASYVSGDSEVAPPLSTDPEAVKAFLRGSQFPVNPGVAQVKASIAYIEEAVRRDPSFAQAHASLGIAYVAASILSDAPPRETMEKARHYAETALALDPGSAPAHQALAGVSHWYDFDHEAADRHIRAAIERSPYGALYNWRAEFGIDLRRFDEAAEANRIATELAPDWLETETVRGNLLLYQRKAALAIPIYQGVLSREPNHGLSRYFLGLALTQVGRGEAAVAELRRANEVMSEPPFARAALAWALARAGQRAEAKQMLADFEHRRAESFYPAFAIAMAHVGLGEKNAALDWLERSVDERLVGYYQPSVELAWEPLREHPRFRALLAQLSLP